MTRPLVVAVAAHGLPGSLLQLPSHELDSRSWAELLTAVVQHRVTAQLVAAVVDGALPATAQQRAEAHDAHLASMSTVLLIDRTLLDVTAAFDDAGIDYRITKGAALAHIAYDDPSERVYGDVDVLVPSEQIEHAVQVMGELGYGRLFPQLRPGFDRRFSKAVTFERPDGFQIDLHRTLLMGPYGLLVDTGRLFDGVEHYVVGGRVVKALCREALVLHTAYTVALGDVPPKPTALRDLAQLLLAGDVDMDELVALATASDGRAVLARGITTGWTALKMADVLPATAWAARYQPSRREVLLMRSYLGPHHSYAAKALDSLRVLPTLRQRVAFARAVAIPRHAFLEQQQVTATGWWRGGSRALLKGGRA